MKVTAATIYVLQSAAMRPVILELQTDEGIAGIGEATVCYGVGAESTAAMLREMIGRFLLGADPSRSEALWSQLYDHTFWAKGGGAVVFAAMSAIDQALWDIKGRALSVPAYELLGGQVHDRLKAYANGWCMGTRNVNEFLRAAEKPLKDGYTTLKFYPLATTDEQGRRRHVERRQLDRSRVEQGIDKVRQLRDLAGPEIEIALDLSGGLTTAATVAFLERVAEYDIFFAEEPADPFDVGAHRILHSKLSVPLAAGERLYTRNGFRPFIEGQILDIVQPDPGTCGGLMELKKIAAFAETYNMRVAPHNSASGLCSAAAIQIATCLSNFAIQEVRPYEKTLPGYVEVLHENPEYAIKDGYFPVPTGPGLGVELNHANLEDFVWARLDGDG